MPFPSQYEVSNKLLRSLRPHDYRRLAACMLPVVLRQKQTLLSEGQVISQVYFPETAVCALVAANKNGALVEVGMFGSEGCSDHVLAPRLDVSTFKTVVQIGGEAWMVSSEDYAQWLQHSRTALEVMLRWQQVTITQLIYTSLANASLPIAERLPRWLLMLQDRVGDTIRVDREWIGLMLAEDATAVSAAISDLVRIGAVQSADDAITVSNRHMLIDACGGGYGPPEQEYERVLGSPDAVLGAKVFT